MSDLERFLHVDRSDIPALVRAGLAHVQFEAIHPFLDGNGRVGRLLITFLLCHDRVLREPLLYLSLYFKQHRGDYYDLLDRVRRSRTAGLGDEHAATPVHADHARRSGYSTAHLAVLREIRDHARRLAEAVRAGGARCIWVGPAHGRNKPEPEFSVFYDRLRAAVSEQCEFIDSRPFAQYPAEGGDGIHYDHLGAPGRAIARAWATSVFELIQPLW